VKTLEKRVRVDDITRGNNVRTAHDSLAITIATTHTITRSAGRHFALGMPRLRIKWQTSRLGKSTLKFRFFERCRNVRDDLETGAIVEVSI
jgi:hypothetical protein